MKKILIIPLIVSVIVRPVFALDLTPREAPASTSGPAIKRYYFADNDKRLAFRLDTSMSFSGGGDAVSFQFSDLSRASMRLSRSQLTPQTPFDEKNLPLYRNAARALLGEEAINVEVEEMPDAIAINGWTSYQLVFTYDLFGLHYRRSVTFLNYSATEQFIVDVTATAVNYDKAYARGYGMLNSITDQPVNADGPT